jgi:hypothetical protein
LILNSRVLNQLHAFKMKLDFDLKHQTPYIFEMLELWWFVGHCRFYLVFIFYYYYYHYFIYLFIYFGETGVRHSIVCVTPPAHFSLVILEMESLRLFAWAGLKL